jgi:two-component system, NtrC family, sensor histidine kinase PilS
MLGLKQSEPRNHLPFSRSWQALQVFSAYRVVLALALFFLFKLNPDNNFLGNYKPELFYQCSLFYGVFSIASFTLAHTFKRLYFLQLDSQVVIDILLIVMLMHASGGASSGLGVLIAISTSAVCILTGTALALSFSVLASGAILAEAYYSGSITGTGLKDINQVGILSITFMTTSLMSYNLAKRIIETENVAKVSIIGLENMEKLNEQIIQYLTTGVLVIDRNNSISLINRAAWIYLGMPESTKSRKLEQVSTPLARQLNLWRRNQNHSLKKFKNTATGPSLLPNISTIDDNQEQIIIFLEDTTQLNQQAQSLKLASLGRLTASIAHEIRNPLGALSHAAQLMKESEEIDPINIGLVDIIDKNTNRVNAIIENIMALSQRKAVQVKAINLTKYIPNMLQEYATGKDKLPDITTQFQSSDLIIHFDQSQLSQILTNLIDNAARYSQEKTGLPSVQIMVGVEPNSHTAFLDVIDKGEGISPDVAEKIFEPFYTTSRVGTGLGLYLAKELCEANRARLDYIPLPRGGSCFRISFSIANLTQK